MKLKFIGTHITENAHGTLRVLAAHEGESVSSILKRLALDFIASKPVPSAPKPRRTRKRKEVAA